MEVLSPKSLSLIQKDTPNFTLQYSNDIIAFRQELGQCHIRVGPMCSGKSRWLNNKLTESADVGLRTLRVSYQDDLRNTTSVDQQNHVTTHDSQFVRMSSKVDVIIVNNLQEVKINGHQVIGVDECQFYSDLTECVIQWLEAKKIIYLTSLDADSDRRLFGRITELLPYSLSFKKKTAFCKYCLDERYYCKAIATASLIKRTEQKAIGGTDVFLPACSRHHSQYNIPRIN